MKIARTSMAGRISVRPAIGAASATRLALILVLFVPFLGEAVHGAVLYAGIESPSPSRIVRAVVSLFGLAVLLRRPLQPLALYVWSLVGAFLLSFAVWSLTSMVLNPVEEAVAFFQLIYGFLLLALLLEIGVALDDRAFVGRAFVWLGTAIASIIIFSFTTGVGLYTYGPYAFGTKGFFDSGNGLGFLLVAALAMALEGFVQRRTVARAFPAFILFFGCIFLGTATSILGAFLAADIYLIVYVFLSRSSGTFERVIKLVVIIVVLSGSAVAATRIYQLVNEYPYLVEKAQQIITEGPRGKLIKASVKYISERNIHSNIFGEGSGSFQTNFSYEYLAKDRAAYGARATVEVDPLDLMGSFGVFITVLIYAPYVLFCVYAIDRYLKQKEKLEISVLFVLILSMLLSIITGHIVNVPTSTTVLATMVAYLILPSRRNRVKMG